MGMTGGPDSTKLPPRGDGDGHTFYLLDDQGLKSAFDPWTGFYCFDPFYSSWGVCFYYSDFLYKLLPRLLRVGCED